MCIIMTYDKKQWKLAKNPTKLKNYWEKYSAHAIDVEFFFNTLKSF